MQHALRESFRGLTEPGRQPAAVLLIDVPPGDVDVNVHPTKSEVRFRDSQRIHGLVLSSIREVLLGNDLTPKAAPRRGDDRGSSWSFTTGNPSDSSTNISRSPGLQPWADRDQVRSRLADFFKSLEPSRSQPHLPTDAPSGPPLKGVGFGGTGTEVGGDGDGREARDEGASGAGAPGASDAPDPSAPDPSAAAPGVDRLASHAIQLHNSYLVAQSDDGLEIIDQHALHERILYEDLLARVSRGPLESQRLLIPHTFPATAGQLAVLGQIGDLLARLGIEAEPFGPTAAAVRAFPSFLHRVEPAEFVADLLEKGEAEALDLHGEELLHDVLDLMACKAAVKAGDRLTPAEVDALLARRHGVGRSSNCPHGRPTTLKLSLKDLEKQFKRTGF